jgi:hypothetical protein
VEDDGLLLKCSAGAESTATADFFAALSGMASSWCLWRTTGCCSNVLQVLNQPPVVLPIFLLPFQVRPAAGACGGRRAVVEMYFTEHLAGAQTAATADACSTFSGMASSWCLWRTMGCWRTSLGPAWSCWGSQRKRTCRAGGFCSLAHAAGVLGQLLVSMIQMGVPS